MTRILLRAAIVLAVVAMMGVSAIDTWQQPSVASGDLPGSTRSAATLIAGDVVQRWSLQTALTLLMDPTRLYPLSGRMIPTPWGKVRVHVDLMPGATFLRLHCAQCRPYARWLAHEALVSTPVTLTVAIRSASLQGVVTLGRARVEFEGHIDTTRVRGEFALQRLPFAEVLAPFGDQIPEQQRAHVRGMLSATGTFSWPEGSYVIAPLLEGLNVDGINVEHLCYGAFPLRVAGRDGKYALHWAGEGSDNWTPLAQMGKYLPDAVLAAEDARFMRHAGYDLTEMRAAFARPVAASVPERGASTLTQQLAKNLFLTPEKTLTRKLRELLYATAMEQSLGKRRILELYLNVADWGMGIHGAHTAAQWYFGQAPGTLQPAQAAWLAAILHNPHRVWNVELQTYMVDSRRVQWVLSRMQTLRRKDRNRLATLVAAVRPRPGLQPACTELPACGGKRYAAGNL